MKILDIPRSGSYQGITSSRNRFGQYVRTRAIPVNPSSAYQAAVRGRLATNSAAWRALTDEQRTGWEALGSGMVRTDALGQSYNLNGFGAYCSVNNNLSAAGAATVSDAPALVVPSAPESISLTAAAGVLTLGFSPTPVPADQQLFVYLSPQRSAGVAFEANFKLVTRIGATGTTGQDITAGYEARAGSLVVGMRIFGSVSTYEGGFLSVPTKTSVVVSA